MEKIKKNRTFRSWRQLVFYIAMVALPTLQFILFGLGLKFNSLVLSFQNYEGETASFAGFAHFKEVFVNLAHDPMLTPAIKNSLILYCCSMLTTCGALLFSFYIYKHRFCSELFRFILFLPQIISSIVLVLIFMYFVEEGLPAIGLTSGGLITNPKTDFGTILFYNVWAGFGIQLMMYNGAMRGIPEAITEAAKIDGASPFQEFIRITIPCIWGTLVTFIVVCITEIFTNMMGLVSFKGLSADSRLFTFGYYIYRETMLASKGGLVVSERLPYLSAMGVTFTVIVVIVTMVVRKLLQKYGPRTE